MVRHTAVERKCRPWKFAPKKSHATNLFIFPVSFFRGGCGPRPRACNPPGPVRSRRRGWARRISGPPALRGGGGSELQIATSRFFCLLPPNTRYLTVSEPQFVPAQPHRPVVFTTDHAHRMETNTPDPLMRPAWKPTPPPLAVSLFLSLFFFSFLSLSLCCVLRHHCDT